MQSEPSNFRAFLTSTLLERCRQNPKYSLRALARNLDLEPSLLSKLLAGKRPVTPRMAARISDRLGLAPSEAQRYARGAAGAEFRQVTEDQFRVISEWYHFPILELLQVSGFTFTCANVAKALGLNVIEARDAIERMERLGLIGKSGTRWKLLHQHNSTVGSAPTSASLRKQQRQVLEKAIHALDETDPADRDQSTVTMAIDKRRLPAAKEKLKTFRRELCAFLESGSSRQEVYMLSLSLFPVTKIQETS
ncbi:MAG: TIGR02147 family protein [Bdellovibrionota bacterium]